MEIDRVSGYFEPEVEAMEQGNRDGFKEEIIKAAVEYAYAGSKSMKAKLDGAGISPSSISGLTDLSRIPLTRKSDLREIQKGDLPFGGLIGCKVDELKRIYVSPGPTYDPEGRDESHWRWEKAFFAAGFRSGDLVQNTFAYHMSPAGLMFDEGLVNIGCTVIPAGTGNTEMQVQVMRELPVSGYVGTPSFLMAILTKAVEMGVDLAKEIGLEVALVAGEMLPESMRQAFMDDFRVMVRQCYGTADLGALGYECVQAEGMHVPDEILLEIVDPETGKQLPRGETGEVVVTLPSRVYPLIRFATGDLSYIAGDSCPCGRTSERLGGIVGRVDQLTKVKGMFVHPSQVAHLLSKFEEVSDAQLLVDREGHEDLMTICVTLLAGVEPSGELKGMIEAESRELLKVRGSVKFVAKMDMIEGGKVIVDRRKWD